MRNSLERYAKHIMVLTTVRGISYKATKIVQSRLRCHNLRVQQPRHFESAGYTNKRKVLSNGQVYL